MTPDHEERRGGDVVRPAGLSRCLLEERSGLIAMAVVGLLLSGLLLGYEPRGGDPDRIFRPIKSELARALHAGTLPYWSERFGLGVPLVAESHAAAFYPPNWLLYGALGVSAGYRLAMWLHNIVLAAATYAYARRLGIGPPGAALAAVALPFCGFLTIQSSHEWAYHTLAYVPLCLLAADGYAATGRARWLAALALLWGVQITLGHFQIQTWTGALALFTGSWRVLADRRPWSRLLGLAIGLGWGLAIAAVQVVPTWELAQLVGQTRRSFAELAFYSYPPSHLAELAVPGLFRSLSGGPEGPYWMGEQTTAFEACLFVGTLPLILALIGGCAGGRGLTPWRVIVPATVALATMPRWWPQGYALILELPGLGYFRCPARYTAITSLGLCLLAGRGLDHAISTARFRVGLGLALLVGATSFAWAWALPSFRPEFHRALSDSGLAQRLGLAALTWTIALLALAAWRRKRMGAWALIVLSAAEVGAFYHLGGTTQWGWSVPLPQASPVLTFLVRDSDVRRVGGGLDNLPVRAGMTTGSPYTGFRLPAPYPWLSRVQDRRLAADPTAVRWLRRFGVTHVVWDIAGADRAGTVVFQGPDPALDQLAYRPQGVPERRQWRAVRLPDPFPEVRVALRSREAPDRSRLLEALSRADSLDEVWYVRGDVPPAPRSQRARSARVVTWDAHSRVAEIAHDGACDVVFTQAHYPGWFARVDGGPEQPISRADGGLAAVRLDGTGTSRVSLVYRPSGRIPATVVTLVATIAALAAAPGWLFGSRAAGATTADQPPSEGNALSDRSPA